jgi:pyruvate kinase
MVARGDLYNEMNYSKLAYAQSKIICACKKHNIPVMIGTGFLESMKYNSRPTRAEIGDVWNAVRDNPYSIMLSAETSNGKYPALAVNTLNHIMSYSN